MRQTMRLEKVGFWPSRKGFRQLKWSAGREVKAKTPSSRARVEKQLPERASERPASALPSLAASCRELPGVERVARGELRLRRRSWRMAAMRCSAVSTGGAAERKLSKKLVWRLSASSVEIRRSERQISYLTASPQRPQTHRPLYRSRTLATYAGVHSSVSPQHAQVAHTSSGFASPAAAATASLLHTFADIAKALRLIFQRQSTSNPLLEQVTLFSQRTVTSSGSCDD
ncbi:hypothetical protein MUK42_30013 [Musa troglodytarum]|uniref:Uncharacterized protein n=1 Tax=Musa troglodytarum TaxID=320322 RepID=A0A9E7K2L7_9LILI|nr:hypothetical protein MUK42_30013 [Musa troglodytarum]